MSSPTYVSSPLMVKCIMISVMQEISSLSLSLSSWFGFCLLKKWQYSVGTCMVWVKLLKDNWLKPQYRIHFVTSYSYKRPNCNFSIVSYSAQPIEKILTVGITEKQKDHVVVLQHARKVCPTLSNFHKGAFSITILFRNSGSNNCFQWMLTSIYGPSIHRD